MTMEKGSDEVGTGGVGTSSEAERDTASEAERDTTNDTGPVKIDPEHYGAVDAAAEVLRESGRAMSIHTGLLTATFVCFRNSARAGWWDGVIRDNEEIDPNVVGTKLALIHSEVSEALEGFRKGLADDHLPHRQMIEVELADAVIRICDLAGALNLDIGAAMVEKLEYNKQREDHKREVRATKGGKKV